MTGKRSAAALPAKLTAPKSGKAVSRTRLFKQLDAVWDKPVIWIGAPAGSGKTTLAASYLAARKIKPLWYQFDARDADPAAFFAYLRQAASRLAPRKRETLPLLTPEYALGLPVFTLNFFDQLFSRLRSPVVLVFDNFQDLPQSSPLQGLLEPLLAAVPDHVNLMFLSRNQAPQSFAGIAAAQRLARLDAASLLLTTEEALAIGEQIVPKGVVRERVEALNARAGGWTAGLILLLGGAGTSDMRAIDADLFSYFAAEIMHCADADTQAFLTTSALLSVMDETSTAELTGNPRAKELLRELVGRNYFITRLAGSPVRYEFHPLFRAFLLVELEGAREDDELRLLRQKAGDILCGQGEYSAAIALLSHANALDEIEAMVLSQAERLVAQGQYQTLCHWLQSIPEAKRDERPWLLYWYGVSRMPYSMSEALDCFERAYASFDAIEDVVGLYSSWACIAEAYSLLWDDFSGMEPWLQAYQSLRSRYPDAPSPQLEVRLLYALLSVLVYLRPHQQICRETCAALENRIDAVSDPDFKVKLLTHLNLYYMWMGDFASSGRACNMMERIIESGQVALLSEIHSFAGRSAVSVFLGDTKGAIDKITSALNLSNATGIYFMRALLLSQQVYATGMEGDLDGMSELLGEMHKMLSPTRRLDYAQYLYQLSWYNGLRGEYALAVSQARQSMDLARQTSAQVPIALSETGLAVSLIYLGEFDEAHRLLDSVQDFAMQMGARYIEFFASLLRAYALLQQGEDEACGSELEQAFQLGMDSGFFAIHALDRLILAALCEFSLERNIKPEYARLLIRKWGLVPKGTMLTSPDWPWPVKIRSLGSFGIEVDDKPVMTSGKRQNRIFEMLKLLISLGGSDVAEQQLCDLLWPDAEGDLARQNFKVTLHRLRKLIGSRAVVMSDGKLALNPGQVWVDLWAFERLLAQLDSATADDVVNLVSEVVENYRGGLLPSENADWVLFARERLRDTFLRIIDRTAERLCDLGQWKAAIHCYQKALDTDPLAERFHLGLMRSHYELGQIADGLVAYQRCRDILASELQVHPSSLTETWHNRLRESD